MESPPLQAGFFLIFDPIQLYLHMKTYSTFLLTISILALTACSPVQQAPASPEDPGTTDTVSFSKSRAAIEPVQELPVEEQKELMQFK